MVSPSRASVEGLRMLLKDYSYMYRRRRRDQRHHPRLRAFHIHSSHLFTQMGRGHKKRSSEAAGRYVMEWASLQQNGASASHQWLPASAVECPVLDLHTHSNCSDGMLSPVQLVEKAHANRVQVLALTDHDTMMGVPAALQAASKHGIRLIPGVEISAKYGGDSGRAEEPVHILGYYGCCGPSKSRELEESLAKIREGRYLRARTMLDKLRVLRKPVKWERVLSIAGSGVAPGRVHIACAMVEAGHVESMREAFNKYLYDGGPAYATGYELAAEEAVQLISNTGGVSALAHPWALKDSLSVIKGLKAVGLHAMEVYRGDGKVNALAALADAYGLVKLGGSDFHGRGERNETGLGKVHLPALAIHEFLKVAEPIWCAAVRDMLEFFGKDLFASSLHEFDSKNSIHQSEIFNGDMSLGSSEDGISNVSLRLSSWLSDEEKAAINEVVSRFKLSQKVVMEHGREILVISQ